jgi:CheY-like chemotaxis protein
MYLESNQEFHRVSRTILLADDEPSVRLLVAKILEMAGYVVIAVEDGEAAAEEARSRAECIDVLISDVTMPKVGGVELAEKMSEICPKTKILLISGYMPEGVKFREGWSFLRKPFSPSVLTERVELLLNAAGKTAVSV